MTSYLWAQTFYSFLDGCEMKEDALYLDRQWYADGYDSFKWRKDLETCFVTLRTTSFFSSKWVSVWFGH